MADAYDQPTLDFYDREAADYVRTLHPANPRLASFLRRLRPAAAILELGCGSGADAEAMLAAGFDVTPTDGSAGIAVLAEARLRRPVQVMRFDELEVTEAYDAVWANACLLHVPELALAQVLGRVRRALRPGGAFYASYKAGDGGARDALGRYNNLPSLVALEAAYREAGPWSELTIEQGPGGGRDGVPRTWLGCLAVKG